MPHGTRNDFGTLVRATLSTPGPGTARREAAAHNLGTLSIDDLGLHGQTRATEGTRGVYERSPTLHRVRGSQNRVAWPDHDPQDPLKPPVLAETRFVSRRFFCGVQPLLRASRVAAGAMGAVVGARR